MSEDNKTTEAESAAPEGTSRRKFLKGGLAAAAGVAAGITGAPAVVTAAAPKVIKMQTSWPSADIWMDFARQYVDRVEKMSGGRLKIDLLPAGAVVKAFQVMDAVNDGVLDAAHSVPVYWYGKNKAASLFGTGPVFGGSVASLDDTAARAVAGVVDVIRLPEPTSPPVFNVLGGVAVLATNSWAAEKGRNALEIEWDPGANAEYSSDSYKEQLIASASAPGNVVLSRGDADKAASSVHEAIYYAPHLAQAPMEPPAALGRVNEDGTCEVWACTQDPQTARGTVAATLGLEPEQVTVNVTLLGGGFGRKSKPDFIAEAAWLAREAGKPVKVQWTREDDIRHGYFHSVSAQYFRAGMDEDGKTTTWLHRTSFPSIVTTFAPGISGPPSRSAFAATLPSRGWPIRVVVCGESPSCSTTRAPSDPTWPICQHLPRR